MKKSSREKLTLFNEWMAEAPDIRLKKEDLDSIIESETMSRDQLKAIRKYFDYEQTDMAILLGVATSTYQKWERIKGANPIPLAMARTLRMYHAWPALTIAILKKPRKV